MFHKKILRLRGDITHSKIIFSGSRYKKYRAIVDELLLARVAVRKIHIAAKDYHQLQ